MSALEVLSRSELRAELDAFRKGLLEDVREVLAERVERLAPLHVILSCAADTARKRIARDPGLRALGVPSGRGFVFEPSAVKAYLKAKR
jgi:hypothetical protein